MMYFVTPYFVNILLQRIPMRRFTAEQEMLFVIELNAFFFPLVPIKMPLM